MRRKTVLVEHRSAFGISRYRVRPGEVENALRYLGARRYRYERGSWIEDPDGEWIRWGGNDMPFKTVSVGEFLEAGGKFPDAV